MSTDGNELFRRWKDKSAEMLQKEIRTLIDDVKNDGLGTIREQGEKLERYLNQLSADEITMDDFEMYMSDMERLARMEARKAKVEAKAAWQRIGNGIADLIIGDLLKLLKG